MSLNLRVNILPVNIPSDLFSPLQHQAPLGSARIRRRRGRRTRTLHSATPLLARSTRRCIADNVVRHRRTRPTYMSPPTNILYNDRRLCKMRLRSTRLSLQRPSLVYDNARAIKMPVSTRLSLQRSRCQPINKYCFDLLF